MYGQLGLCSGSSGDPIFTDDFGVGTTPSMLPAGTTGYVFSSGDPFDGQYQVSSDSDSYGWHRISDHTPGDSNGKMLIINADLVTVGEFYKTTITGLCSGTTYEFSSWMVNLSPSFDCGGSPIPINVTFEILDSSGNVIKGGSTGNIAGTSAPNWVQYGIVFKTAPGQDSVVLRLSNNGTGGCGNDLALDDIVFKSCGDQIDVLDTLNNSVINICEGEDLPALNLTATPDFNVFASHFYQWQESTDGINWVDLFGETSQSYTTTPINNVNGGNTNLYRVKVAENISNVNNSLCNTISNTFSINVIPIPDAPLNTNSLLSICEGDTTPLTVTVPNGVVVNWYDASSNGNLLLVNSRSYNPSVSGVYYAEAQTTAGGCVSSTRTPMEITFSEVAEYQDETLEFCQNTDVIISANVLNTTALNNETYFWQETNEITESIIVDEQGIYHVDITNGSCTVTKTVTLNRIDNPIIEGVVSEGSDIVITTANTGDFLYSLDGNIFQSSNRFVYVDGGLYTIYVKERRCDELITEQHLHFYIPKFFTPNGDGENDTFDLKGIEFYASSSISIFDRYGKLLKHSTNAPFSWDGNFVGKQLPTDDYWYVVVIDGQKFTGHFTLKR